MYEPTHPYDVPETHGDGPDDGVLVARVRAGETENFEALIKRHELFVTRVAARHVPRDAVREVAHEAFVRAFESLGSFEGRSPFRHWLSRLALRACYDYWRGRERRRETPVSAFSEDHAAWIETALAKGSVEAFEREASSRDAKELVAWALSGLSAEDRMIVTLVHLEDVPIAEVAKVLGWSSVRVRVKAHRVRRELRGRIEKLLGTEGGRP